jgi:prepilin-type N-terminal cleavage/methylation domain-containing protein
MLVLEKTLYKALSDGGITLKLIMFICKKNNKGYSLVEVIVAMLILAIITIPLLTSFNFVAKANLNTREKQYAGNVASNVLEGVKQFGIAETSIQMHGEISTQFPFNYFSAGNYLTFGETMKDFTTVIGFNSPVDGVSASIARIAAGQYKFLPRNHLIEGNDDYNNNYYRKYYYMIEGIKEGTMLFDAHITFDATTDAYQSSENTLNNFKLADLTSLNSSRTAVISPSGVWYTLINDETGAEVYDKTKNFETEALRVFEERYREYMNISYTERKDKAVNTNELISKAVAVYIERAIGESGDGFNDIFSNYLINESDKNKPIVFIHGSYYDVTDAYIERAKNLRIAAYNFYKENYAASYETYANAGYTLEDDTIYVDIDAITKVDPLVITGLGPSDVDAVFVNRISRLTKIEIKKDGSYFLVNSSTVFTFNQGNDSLLVSADADEETKENELTYVCEGYFSNMRFEAIENIYLFQDGPRNGNFKEDEILIDYSSLGYSDVDAQMITDRFGNESKIGLYVVWQYDSDKTNVSSGPFYSDSVRLIYRGSKKQQENFVVYKTPHPSLSYWAIRTAGDDADRLSLGSSSGTESLIADVDNTDRAYTVTIEIYRRDTGELLVTEKAAIKE